MAILNMRLLEELVQNFGQGGMRMDVELDVLYVAVKIVKTRTITLVNNCTDQLPEHKMYVSGPSAIPRSMSNDSIRVVVSGLDQVTRPVRQQR